MKLLVPVNSIESAKTQIEAGADELFVGIATQWGKNVSFSARGNYRRDGNSMVLSFDELNELSAICTESGTALHVAVNNLHPTGFISDHNQTKYNYMDFIKEVMKTKIDSLIIADLAAIMMARELNPDIPITSSTVMEATNAPAANFLKEYGVTRVVLPYQITLDEISTIRQAVPDIELEIFAHYGCSFHDGHCMLKHNVGEAGKEGINVATPCRNVYALENFDNMAPKAYLDASLVCSICSIPNLVKNRVDVIKLVGRELPGMSNIQLTKVYRQAIDKALQGEKRVTELQKELPVWWKRTLCKSKLCKYQSNPITKSFTGREGIEIEPIRENPELRQATPTIPEKVHEVHLTNTNYLDHALNGEVEQIGIGHEHCSLFVRNREALQETVSKIKASNKQVLLVTPSVQANEYDDVVQSVHELLQLHPDIDIVFNSYGVLLQISSLMKGKKEGKWWLGRLLSRSQSDWPWFDVITREESEEVKNTFRINSLIHDKLFPVLKGFGIDGFTVNNSEKNEKNCQLIKEAGFETKVHLGPKLLAVSRSCIQLSDKLDGVQKKSCDGNCQQFDMKLQSLENADISPEEQARLDKYYPEFTVFGAGVFEKGLKPEMFINENHVDRTCVLI